MKSIKEFIGDIINESHAVLVNVFIPKNPQGMIDWLKDGEMTDGKPYNFNADGYFSEKNINDLFKISQNTRDVLGKNNDLNCKLYPFVCRNLKVGDKIRKAFVVRRMYGDYINNIKQLTQSKFRKGGFKGLHDTSYNDAGKSSAARGIKWEYIELDNIIELCKYIKEIIKSSGLQKLTIDTFKKELSKYNKNQKIINNDLNSDDNIKIIDIEDADKSILQKENKLVENFRKFYALYDAGVLNDLIENIDNSGIDLTNFIKNTGNQNTHRNSNGKIINNTTCELAVDINNLKNILKDSGRIISDITLNPNSFSPTYLSIKLERQQQSSISVNAFKRDKELVNIINSLKINDKINSIKWGDVNELNDINVTISKPKCLGTFNICKLLGINIENYILHCLNKSKNNSLKTYQSLPHNEIDAGLLYLSLIGGNYWYVQKGTEVVYMPYDYKDYRFKCKNYRFTSNPGEESGSNIEINGDLYFNNKSISCQLTLRSSGNNECRIIPKIDIHRMRELL